MSTWLLLCNDIMVKNDLPLRGNLRQLEAPILVVLLSRFAAAHLWYRGGKRK